MLRGRTGAVAALCALLATGGCEEFMPGVVRSEVVEETCPCPFEFSGSSAVYTSGFVGIGTDAPTNLLTVAGKIELVGDDAQIIFPDGSTLETFSILGDVTGITAGDGLTGGGISGEISLEVDFAGTGAATTVSRSDHTHFALSASDGAPATALAIDAAGNASLLFDAAVNGALGVTGATTLSTLATSGAATLNSTAVTNNATVGGTLGVTGATTLSTLATSGAATLNSTAVTNNATVGGTLGVTGATTLGSTLGVTGNATFSGTITGATYGTTTDVDVTIRANNRAALRIESNGASPPNIVGGEDTNATSVGVVGAVIAGGETNAAVENYGAIGGGLNNSVAGRAACVPGGQENAAEGEASLAAGNRAKALHHGAFVWADSTAADFSSTADNQFLVRAAGGVGIGTTNPELALSVAGGIEIETSQTTSPRLLAFGTVGNFTGGAESTDVLGFYRFQADTNESDLRLLIGDDGGPGSIDAFSIGRASGTTTADYTEVFRLESDGDAFKPGGGDWTSLSDARLKTSVAPLSGALDRLLELRGYQFEFTPAALRSKLVRAGVQVGLIAQEVERVFPDWVGRDRDGYLTVTERGTTAMMIEALRELRCEKDDQVEALADQVQQREAALADSLARVDQLEAAHRALEARVAALEARLIGTTDARTTGSAN